jgi:peptidoglycan/LPS O-acetylase OafA/YrhL
MMPVETGFLNGIRAIAAFWVLSAHCMIWGGWYGLPIPDPKIAVDLFMILSGFLMAHTMDERTSPQTPKHPRPWLEFYVRRFFRIAPAYYLSLGLAVVLAPIFLGGYAQFQDLNPAQWVGNTTYDPRLTHYDLTNIAMHVSFLFGLIPRYAASTMLPDWSLGLEMQFYAAFPIIFAAARKYGVFGTCLALAVICHFLNGG